MIKMLFLLLPITIIWGFLPDISPAQQAQRSRFYFPGKNWQVVENPEEFGWSTKKLKKAKQFAKEIGSDSVMIVEGGRLITSWGDVDEPINCHSVRKSFLSALYGVYVSRNRINLNDTLQNLGIDDYPPSLTRQEKSARVIDLLKARSGIYHLAAYETKSMKEKRPERGSHKPGSFWYYNNWDFNTLGAIFERKAGLSVFAAFEKEIAYPIQMQDFDITNMEYKRQDVSKYPAYLFYVSTRDMARFGLLFLSKGNWNGKQIIPRSWVDASTTAYSDAGKSGGYGYLWWVAVDGKHFSGVDLGEGAFSARGNGGHYIIVAPALNLVIAHHSKSDYGDDVDRDEFSELLELILEAKR